MGEVKKTGLIGVIVAAVVGLFASLFAGDPGAGDPGAGAGPVTAPGIESPIDAADDPGGGLAGMDDREPVAVPRVSDAAVVGVGLALDPVTGGVSGVVAGLVVGVSRLLREVKRRGDAIVEIDRFPDTVRAADQVKNWDSYRTIRKLTDAGA